MSWAPLNISSKGGLYRGNGCHWHPDCFTCPLPECAFEMGGARAGSFFRHRARAALEAQEQAQEQVARATVLELFQDPECRKWQIAQAAGIPIGRMEKWLREMGLRA